MRLVMGAWPDCQLQLWARIKVEALAIGGRVGVGCECSKQVLVLAIGAKYPYSTWRVGTFAFHLNINPGDLAQLQKAVALSPVVLRGQACGNRLIVFLFLRLRRACIGRVQLKVFAGALQGQLKLNGIGCTADAALGGCLHNQPNASKC